jgi:hypothetical protein
MVITVLNSREGGMDDCDDAVRGALDSASAGSAAAWCNKGNRLLPPARVD